MIKSDDDGIKLEKLFLKYSNMIYKVAYNILNDHQLAQDAAQMTFVKIIENIEKIDEVNCSKTKAFFVIICRNISINIYNNRKRNISLTIDKIDDIVSDPADNLDDQLISKEILSLVKGKMKLLYPPYADIIALRYTFEYSEKEISSLLGISDQNVRVRLHRAKKSLLKLICEDKEAEIG